MTADRYERIRARGKDKPETLHEAQGWERVNGKYRAAGLCAACASQAAWGHQSGFANVHPPCEVCVPVVDAFPLPAGEGSPWRRHRTGRKHPAVAHTTGPEVFRVVQLPPTVKPLRIDVLQGEPA